MKSFILALFVAVAAARTLSEDMRLYADFKMTFGRQYSASEDAHRFQCFRQNLAINDKLNAVETDAVFGINQFADMCASEFKNHHNARFSGNNTAGYITFSADEVSAAAGSVDWRTKGAVTAIKNQGMCGSCWSFSATGNMEGQVFLKTGSLKGLSEEELVQCSHNGDMGCNGGLMDNAFEWVIQNNGIDSEANYPYTSGTGRTGTCDNSKLKQVSAKISSYKNIQHSEDQMKAFVSTGGPLSIGVDAASGWQTYMGGIMKNCNGRSLDHGVLIVGYDTSASTPYWIVKNSWGASWGESGYIRLEYGTDQCGLTGQPSSSVA